MILASKNNKFGIIDYENEVDGLKTGYTKNAGYCLIGTANREGTRLVGTVTGSESKSARANEVQSLLQFGYGAYDGLVVYSPGDQVKALPLWMGTQSEAAVSVPKNLGIIFPKGKKDLLSAALELPESLEAPMESGTKVGHIQVKFDGHPVLRSPLQVEGQYDEGPWYSQLLDSIKQMIF